MSDVNERIARLSPEQRALLERLLRKERASESTTAIRPRPATSAELPLSFGQQRLWFLDQMEPGRSIYNVFDSYLLEAPVDPVIAERSVNEIVRRHEALRTTFVQRNHAPVQMVAPNLELTLDVHDFSALEVEQREIAVEQLSARLAEQPFDLTNGPLLRVALLTSGEDVCVLLVSMHHIVTDAWSLEVFEREFRALYAAFAANRPSPLPPLPIQFADFALWQRQRLSGETLRSELAHWTRTLSGAPRILDLPIAKARPPMPTYRGAAQSWCVTRHVTQSLRALAQLEGATMFMTTLAAFNVLLCRYTGQHDLVVGTPVACRDRAEIEPLIGFFVNTIVIRTDLSGDPTFREVLRRTKAVCLNAFAHQEVPFETLVEALQPDRDPSRNPLFQVTFQCSTVSGGEDEDPGGERPGMSAIDVAPEVQPGTAKFDLALNVWDRGGTLRLQVDYSTDLFDDAAVTRLLGHFERLLACAADKPDVAIATLPMLSDADRRETLEAWNDTATEYPSHATLDELFARQVAASPTSVAIVEGDHVMTYEELDRRATTIARRLLSRDIGPESFVGLCVARSTDMVVGLLGIVKAGAAYVPLDPDYPADRLAFMARDASLRVLVTDGDVQLDLPGSGACEIVSVRSDNPAEVDGGPVAARTAAPDSPAYVVYTSGSTGTPKGVVVTHRGVARTVCGTNYLTIVPTDRVAQASNTSFDAATFEIWGTLLNGATLVITPPDLLLVPDKLAERIRELGLTVLFVTTAVLNHVAARAPRAFAGLRCLLFGGETADAGAVRRVLREGPPHRTLHLYGPTECTTFTTFYVVDTVSEGASSVPIGRPVSNTSVYILDEALQPVPIGVVGELYVGGPGLARGYLHDASLTADRFVPRPFGGAPGERLYRSGDLAKYLPGGVIEFVGRRDGQVKIRGFRIELGEVEAVLREHPDVEDVVAVCRRDAGRDNRLVAYVVARPGRSLGMDEVRAHMARRSPAYMLPSAFVILPMLPLTANGKVDRAALPSPHDVQQPSVVDDNRRPRTPTEDLVSSIFTDILRVESIGVGANFFEWGGHSLLATQVVSRVREALHVDLPLRTVFTSPTVATLAAAIDESRAHGLCTSGPAITRVARDAYRVQQRSDGNLEIPDALKPLLHIADK